MHMELLRNPRRSSSSLKISLERICALPDFQLASLEIDKKGPERNSGLFSCREQTDASDRVVHIVFDRMRGHAITVAFFALEIEIAVDLVIGENSTLLEEFAVLVE